jgi:hypothetical protein
MAFLGGTFDSSNIDPSAPFEILPAGDYKVAIVDSSMDPTKNGNGQYLKLHLQVLDGQHKGQILFDRLNLDNPNPKAVEIAQRVLSAICHAVGVLQVSDSSQLHNRPLLARVVIKAAQGEYQASNEIKGYKPASAASATPAFVPPTAQAAPAFVPPVAQPATAASAPPWMGSAQVVAQAEAA